MNLATYNSPSSFDKTILEYASVFWDWSPEDIDIEELPKITEMVLKVLDE